MTSRLEKLKQLSDLLGGDNLALALRMEKAVEAKMIEERAIKEAVRQVQAQRATFKDDVKVPARKSKARKSKAQKSKQKERRAVDPVSSFMAGLGVQLQPGKKTKEKRQRDPISTMLTGITWK